MTDTPDVTPVPPKKPGRKSRAEIEAEIRAEIEAEARANAEAAVRAEYAEREAEAEQARALAAEARPIKGDDISADPSLEGAVTIHFVEDGLTMLGKVWYRGEELTLIPDSSQWREAEVNLVKGGKETKVFALMDEYEQEAKWGRRFFRPGPWRGARLDEIDDELLTPEERAQLAKAQQLRDARFGKVLH